MSYSTFLSSRKHFISCEISCEVRKFLEILFSLRCGRGQLWKYYILTILPIVDWLTNTFVMYSALHQFCWISCMGEGAVEYLLQILAPCYFLQADPDPSG